MSQAPTEVMQNTDRIKSVSATNKDKIKFSIPDLSPRYQIGGILGKGGNATIIEARDNDLKRPVALKLLKTKFQTNSVAVARFLNEAQVTSQLEHPGVVPVHEIGCLGESNYFFAMKKVEGQTLRDIVAEEGGTTFKRLLAIFQRVSETMAFAHTKGIVHRDIKPENIMIENFGSTLIMDWGLAKNLNDPNYVDPFNNLDLADDAPKDEDFIMTQVGEITGTPAYMSPEQSLGMMKNMDERSDVFSLGIILYELVTGTNPFLESFEDSFRKIFTALKFKEVDSPVLTKSQKKVPVELQAIILKCLMKLPKDRYQNAGELFDDFTCFLENKPVSAYSTSVKTSLSKWFQRKAKYILPIGLVLLASSIFSISQAYFENSLENYVEEQAANLKTGASKIDRLQNRMSKLSSNSARGKARNALRNYTSQYSKDWQRMKGFLIEFPTTDLSVLNLADVALIKKLWFLDISRGVELASATSLQELVLAEPKLWSLNSKEEKTLENVLRKAKEKE